MPLREPPAIMEGMLKLLNQLTSRFAAKPITVTRIVLAVAIAAIADFLQVVLLPLEWIFAQQIVDVLAMVLIVAVLGFHPLLLPTFAVEFIPVVDMLPTWTGCVVAVIALRKRAQNAAPLVNPQAPGEQTPLPEKIARRTDSDI